MPIDKSILSRDLNSQVSYGDFFHAFGYDRNDRIYLRALDDKKRKESHGKNNDISLKQFNMLRSWWEHWQGKDYGIFFSVNGAVGNDAVIAAGIARAQFMEIDPSKEELQRVLSGELDIDELLEIQLQKIADFPLEPSIIVRTWKSLHCYWLLDHGQIKYFRELQQRLAQYFGSDSSVQNEERVMRLYGTLHQKHDPVMTRLVKFSPELRYTQEQLNEVLPKLQAAPKPAKDPGQDPAEDGQKIPEGKGRHFYVVKRCGHYVGKLGADVDPELIYPMVEADFYKNCEVSPTDNMEEFHRKYLQTIRTFQQRKTAEDADPGFFRYAVKAWEHENGRKFDSSETSWEEVADAGHRAKESEWEPETARAVQDFSGTSDPEIADPRHNGILSRLKELNPEQAYDWNDKGNGSLYAEIFRDVSRWNVTVKDWYYYTGKAWKPDIGGMIAARNAKMLSDALLIYCTTLQDERQRTDYIKHVSKLGQLKYRETMLKDSRDVNFLSAEMLDADSDLLNLQNGVLNLKTMEFLDHSPDLLLSKICNVSYDPEADCTAWEKFINDVMEGDAKKADYLQRILGYALTAETKEEGCYILYGQSTRNGKSTLTETISYMLGGSSGYAMNMNPETLAKKKENDSRRASPDLARLKDARFLNTSEPPKRMLFDAALLKTMLGRDKITARFLNQNEIEFTPKFKLFMNTNYLPTITDETLFTSGRINVITFDRHFAPAEQDKGLKDRLRNPAILSGIFRWCLEGLKKYRARGLEPPESVKAATDEYRQISDKIGRFFEEEMIKAPGRNSPAGSVYNAYAVWCDANGYGCENKGNFFEDLQAKGLFARSGTIQGRTVRNVVKNYMIRSDFERTGETFPEEGQSA